MSLIDEDILIELAWSVLEMAKAALIPRTDYRCYLAVRVLVQHGFDAEQGRLQ